MTHSKEFELKPKTPTQVLPLYILLKLNLENLWFFGVVRFLVMRLNYSSWKLKRSLIARSIRKKSEINHNVLLLILSKLTAAGV